MRAIELGGKVNMRPEQQPTLILDLWLGAAWDGAEAGEAERRTSDGPSAMGGPENGLRRFHTCRRDKINLRRCPLQVGLAVFAGKT